MKLRLPKKLSIALLASITVGFTLSQAEAATKYSTPTYGGAEYIWTNGHWEYPAGTQVNKIARVDNKGGVMVIDNAGTVSNPASVSDTSDYGGVKVMGDTTFTTTLGGWAGSIFVEAAAVLNASYNRDLKNTEAATAANVYVDGTLNITGRSNLNLNDGNDYQNWYIGETGFINLSAITSVNKGSRDWNIQLGVDEGEPFDLTVYTNRTLGGQLTKKFMSTGADLYGQVASFAVFCEGVELDSSKYTINHDANGMSVTYDAETAISKMSLTWAGGEAAWELKGTNWTDAEGTPTSFANGDDVTFAGSGNKANVGGAVEANAITVTGGVIIDSTADGASLKAGSLSVAAGGDLSIASGKDVNIDTITIADNGGLTVQGSGTVVNTRDLAGDGVLGIGEGAMVKLTPSEYQLTSTKTIRISGEGTLSLTTLKINGGTHNITSNIAVTGGDNGEGSTNNKLGINFSEANGTLNINAGITTVTGAVYSNQDGTTINIGTDDTSAKLVTCRLEIGDYNSAASSSCSYLTIGKNGTVVVTSTNDASGYTGDYKTTGLILSEWCQQTVASVAGKLYAQNVKLYHGDTAMDITIQNGGVVAVKGISQGAVAKNTNSNITLKDDGKLILGESGIVSGGGTWSITLNGGEIGMTADTTLARAMNVAGDVTFNTAKYIWSGAADTLALNEGIEGGIMTISGNITGEGSVTKTGAGTLVLSGTNNVLTHTIAANEGSMTLYGSYEIGDIALVGTTVYGDGEHEGNGYATATGTITVFSGAAKDSVDADAATFTYHGAEVTVTDGVYTLPGTQDTTTYYINEDTDSYGWIDTHKKGDLVFGIVVKAGATLQADKDMSMAALAAPSKGTVDIDDGVVVTAAGGTQAVKITGAGTYALASGEQTLGRVNADDYDGYVRLSGNIVNINLDGNLQGKNVELSGVSGYFKNVDADSQAVFNGNLRMSDVNGTPAITVTTGYSRDRAYLVFSGAVSGNGTWELNCGATQHYVFSGDISAWDGTFHVTRSGASYGGTSINFCGDAKEVNASIIKLEAGTLNLIVGDGQSSFTTTFKNTVEASSLTVQKHATAILGGDATISDSLTLHGLLKTDGGSLSLKDGVSLSLGEGAEMQFGSAMSMKAKQGGAMGVSDNTVIEATSMHSKDGGMGVLNNVNVDIIEDYTIENMSISGSLIDVGEGTKLYLVNVDIHSDTHITDEAAWLDMQATNAWLDENNAHVMGRHVTTEDTTLYLSGDPSQAITMAAGRVVVELTSDMFDTVTMTGGEPGVDLWLDMTAIADAFEGADYVALDFRNLAREFSNAMVDVEKLQVNVTLDGERYTEAYSTANGGLTTTLYFQVPEPSTGTLSLLALAALAARRRRK